MAVDLVRFGGRPPPPSADGRDETRRLADDFSEQLSRYRDSGGVGGEDVSLEYILADTADTEGIAGTMEYTRYGTA